MIDRKLSVFAAHFSYAGNGGFSSITPDIRTWWATTLKEMKADQRIERVYEADFIDTPITMTRNAAVIAARSVKADLLLMVDSDMRPDSRLARDANARPFWSTAFDFIHERYEQGPNLVFAPYCGMPPNECVFVFRWHRPASSTNTDTTGMSLEMYGREEAAQKSGIEPVAAGPTGLILFDMRLFELTDPSKAVEDLVAKGVPRYAAQRMVLSWFDYEFADIWHSRKASTEDVVSTRDMSLTCQSLLGYNPVHCAWDCWAGHWKPVCVDRPKILTTDEISEKYRHALATNHKAGETVRHVVAHGLEKLAKRNAADFVAETLASPEPKFGRDWLAKDAPCDAETAPPY